MTVVDFSEERGREVASLVEKESAKFHSKLEFPSAMFIKCDVSNTSKSNNVYFCYMISFLEIGFCFMLTTVKEIFIHSFWTSCIQKCCAL